MTSPVPQTPLLPIEVRGAPSAGETGSTGKPAAARESAAETGFAGSPFAQLLNPPVETPGPVSQPAPDVAAAGNTLPQTGSGLPVDEDAGRGLPIADLPAPGTAIGVPTPAAAAPTAAVAPAIGVSEAMARTAGSRTTHERALPLPASPSREQGAADGRQAQAGELLARQPASTAPSDTELPVPSTTAPRSPSAAAGTASFVTRESPPAAFVAESSPNDREAPTAIRPSRADSVVQSDWPPHQLAGRQHDSPHERRADPVLKHPETATSPQWRGDASGRPAAMPVAAASTPMTADQTGIAPLAAAGHNARDPERRTGGAGAPGRVAPEVVISRQTGTAAGLATVNAATEMPGDAGESAATRFGNLAAAGPRTASVNVASAAMKSPGEEAAAVGEMLDRATRPELAAEPRPTGEVRVDRVLSVAPSLTVPVQGPSGSVVTQGAGAAPTSIDVPVVDPAWGEAMGRRVSMLLSRNVSSAELRLSPAELGPLQVQIAVDDNVARVTFSAAHAVTREALEQALPRLREMLADQGISLADANVSDQRGGSRGDGTDPALTDLRAVDREAHPDSVGHAPSSSVGPPTGRLDTYA